MRPRIEIQSWFQIPGQSVLWHILRLVYFPSSIAALEGKWPCDDFETGNLSETHSPFDFMHFQNGKLVAGRNSEVEEFPFSPSLAACQLSKAQYQSDLSLTCFPCRRPSSLVLSNNLALEGPVIRSFKGQNLGSRLNASRGHRYSFCPLLSSKKRGNFQFQYERAVCQNLARNQRSQNGTPYCFAISSVSFFLLGNSRALLRNPVQQSNSLKFAA